MIFFRKPINYYLVYLSIKGDIYNYETVCSIMSFKENNKNFKGKIVIYTDSKTFFKNIFIDEKFIIIIEIDNKTISNYLKDSNYIYSIKLYILIQFSGVTRGKVIYVDSDTFFLKNINSLFKKISDKRFLLHCREYKISSKVNENYYNQLKEKKIKIFFKERIIKITTEVEMWNSGVIGFDTSNLIYLEFALEILKKLQQNNINEKTIEQLSLSFSFSELKIFSADKYIFHYWFIKVFRTVLWKYYFKSEKELILNENDFNFVNNDYVKKVFEKSFLSKYFRKQIFLVVNNCYSNQTKLNIKKNFNAENYIFKKIK